MDNYTTRFKLKESEKVYRHSCAGQASIVVEKAAIIKQKMANCKKVCRKALYIFVINTWLNSINKIMFLYKWRAKLVKHGFFIKLSIDFIKTLKVNCNLIVLGIQKNIFFILKIILFTIENDDC